MKKVVIVLDNMKMGGSERQALFLASCLHKIRDVDVKILALQPPAGRISDLCDEKRISWSLLNFSRSRNPLKLVAKLQQIAYSFSQEQPDILLPFTLRANVVCGLIWRATGAKTAIWNQRAAEHGVILGKHLDFIAARLSPICVANSHQGAAYISKIFGRPLDQIRVINNGIQPATPKQSRSTWRRFLGISENCFAVCMVANIHALKDHTTLLHAWRIVHDHLNSAGQCGILVLAGRHGVTYRSLLQLTYELQIAEQVRFLGEVDDIAGLLTSVDLGVHSSHSEGCPNGILECMAAGLPVVATDIPGARSALGDRNENWFVPKNDARKLALKILAFATDSDLRSAVGQMNRKRVTTQFSIQRMCNDFCHVIGIPVPEKLQESIEPEATYTTVY